MTPLAAAAAAVGAALTAAGVTVYPAVPDQVSALPAVWIHVVAVAPSPTVGAAQLDVDAEVVVAGHPSVTAGAQAALLDAADAVFSALMGARTLTDVSARFAPVTVAGDDFPAWRHTATVPLMNC